MSTSESVLTIDCPICQMQNDGAMSFCIYCGQNLRSQLPSTLGNMCTRCGRFDQFSTHYCIFCGADTTRPRHTETMDISKFSWEMDAPAFNSGTSVAHVRMSPRVVALANIATALLGCIVAALVAPAAKKFVSMKTLQAQWPKQALVLITKHPDATVVFNQSAGPDQLRLFTAGRLGPTGFLEVQNLPAGKYVLRLSAPQFQTSVYGLKQSIDIGPNFPTVLGFGSPLSLTPRHDERE